MRIVLFAIALLTGLAGALTCHKVSRRNYCAQACSDARACGFGQIPDNCEERCEIGSRAIDLPRKCEQLKHNIDTAGYLW